MKSTYSGENQLDIAKEDLLKTRETLLLYFNKIGYKGNIQKKIDTIVNQCTYSWYRAPKKFEDRIKAKLGRNGLDFRAFSKEEVVADTILSVEKEDNGETNGKAQQMSKEEKKFIADREKEYRKDYEFNNSSDLPILNEVLIDEVILKRLQNDRILGKNYSRLEDRIDKVRRRILNNMEKLGILRNQRIDQDNSVEGNISQLSVMVDKKLDEMIKLEDEAKRKKYLDSISDKFSNIDQEEVEILVKEVTLQKKHDTEPQSNFIPEAELSKVMNELTNKKELSSDR